MKRKLRIAMMAALIMVMGFTFAPTKAATGECPLYGTHRYELENWVSYNEVWVSSHYFGFPIVKLCNHYNEYDIYTTRCECGAPGPQKSVLTGTNCDYPEYHN